MGDKKKTDMRLDKFLAEMGAGSRGEVKPLIRKGKVLVNGIPVRQPEQKINPEQDRVVCDGVQMSYVAQEYFMLNKPAGVLSAANDKRAVTVVDLITDRQRRDLFPVGRLDKDTEGLLLITNDGALAHRLLSPKKHVDKTYYVELDQSITPEDRCKLEAGVDIGDEKLTLPCSIQMEPTDTWKGQLDGAHLLITIQEGRFHQIKRMFETCGSTVTYLKRLSMGPLKLDESLAPGAYRRLTSEELAALTQEAEPCHD